MKRYEVVFVSTAQSNGKPALKVTLQFEAPTADIAESDGYSFARNGTLLGGEIDSVTEIN